MFRFEKDMIPVLKVSMADIFKTKYFVEEFSSGLGIADLVFAKKIIKRNSVLQDFEAMYYLSEYFNKKMSKIIVEDFIVVNSLKKNKAYQAINFLKLNNLLKDHMDGSFCFKGSFKPSVNEFYSIEAKLKDWKQGLYQALRYKNYSHKTFLAISAEFIHRVDKSLLIENNVGLISVNVDSARIIIQPKSMPPINQTAFYHLSENFVTMVS